MPGRGQRTRSGSALRPGKATLRVSSRLLRLKLAGDRQLMPRSNQCRCLARGERARRQVSPGRSVPRNPPESRGRGAGSALKPRRVSAAVDLRQPGPPKPLTRSEALQGTTRTTNTPENTTRANENEPHSPNTNAPRLSLPVLPTWR